MVSAEDEVEGFGLVEQDSWMGIRIERAVLAANEGLVECNTGIQQNFKCAAARRGACGCVDFSVSEGSSDIPARASAGGYGDVESCATVAP